MTDQVSSASPQPPERHNPAWQLYPPEVRADYVAAWNTAQLELGLRVAALAHVASQMPRLIIEQELELPQIRAACEHLEKVMGTLGIKLVNDAEALGDTESGENQDKLESVLEPQPHPEPASAEPGQPPAQDTPDSGDVVATPRSRNPRHEFRGRVEAAGLPYPYIHFLRFAYGQEWILQQLDNPRLTGQTAQNLVRALVELHLQPHPHSPEPHQTTVSRLEAFVRGEDDEEIAKEHGLDKGAIFVQRRAIALTLSRRHTEPSEGNPTLAELWQQYIEAPEETHPPDEKSAPAADTTPATPTPEGVNVAPAPLPPASLPQDPPPDREGPAIEEITYSAFRDIMSRLSRVLKLSEDELETFQTYISSPEPPRINERPHAILRELFVLYQQHHRSGRLRLSPLEHRIIKALTDTRSIPLAPSQIQTRYAKELAGQDILGIIAHIFNELEQASHD